MKIKLEPAQICLGRNQILEIEQALGFRILCSSGSVWITQDGDRRDIVLESGESFAFDRTGVALVNALKPAAVSVEAVGRAGAKAPSFLARAGSAAAHWFGAAGAA